MMIKLNFHIYIHCKQKTMKKNHFTCIFITIAIIGLFYSCRTAVMITASEQDAQIFVNGRPIGSGSSADIIKVKKHACSFIQVEKIGFLSENLSYCYNGTNLFTPKEKFIVLKRDDAYDASIKNDYANKDFEQEVSKKYSETEAWKIISQIVTNYFDIIEMADKETGYMKTSWQSRSFTQKTIRTRIIVKQSSSSPLKYMFE